MKVPWPENADIELALTASVLVDHEELANIRSTNTIRRPIIEHWDGQFGKFIVNPKTSDKQLTLDDGIPRKRILNVVHLVVKRTSRKGEIYKEKAESRLVFDACRGLEEWILDLGPAIEW